MPRIEIKLPKIRKTTLRSLRKGVAAAEVMTGPDKWYLMAWAYKEAGDRLAARMTKSLAPWEILAAPMLFLYRHYIELHLKSLLLDTGELLDAPQTVEPKHYILSLWKKVRKLLLKVDGRPPDKWFKRADQIISDFDGIDPTSFAFRYPVDPKGRASLSPKLLIDARNVRKMIAELHLLLDGASSQISEYQQYKYEY